MRGRCRSCSGSPARCSWRSGRGSRWRNSGGTLLAPSASMMVATQYAEVEPRRSEVDALAGPTLLEFGSPWCGWWRRAQPLIAGALATHSGGRHIKVPDPSGRRLGRSFGVKLWPTLVFLRDGKEAAQLVRPKKAAEITKALAAIDPR